MDAATDIRATPGERESDLIDIAMPLARRWRSVIAVPIAITLATYCATYLFTPIFTASTLFLPPQQQQSIASSALASLGALAGVAGGATGVKSPADEYVSLMQSETVTDRMIDRYKLISRYDVRYRLEARKELLRRSTFTVGKKDGLISVEVDDADPKTAAAMANSYVSELQAVTATLAVSEAQQRRVFFERLMQQTKDRLVAAQVALQQSGFNPSALKAEPKAAADTYASLQAQLTTAQVRLQMMRSSLAETSPDVVRQRAVVDTLQQKINEIEASAIAQGSPTDADYVGKYREFKYQETLFDQMARQYEIARVDESREGALIQVVDPAKEPERRSRPKRTLIALGAGFVGGMLYVCWLVARSRWHAAKRDSRFAARVEELHAALRTR